MADLNLLDKQKNLLRLIAQGLASDKVPRTWHLHSTLGAPSLHVSGFDPDALGWGDIWATLTIDDFDVLVIEGFFVKNRPTVYTLVRQKIVDAVERNFTDQSLVSGTANSFPRIFISYKREDRDYTNRLSELLRRIYEHNTVWYDTQLLGGQDWWDEIIKQIDQSDILIYLLSRESLESVYCRAEFAEARRLQKQVLPIRIAANADFQAMLGRIHIIHAPFEHRDIKIDDLIEIIRTITHRNGYVPQVVSNSLWAKHVIQPSGNNRIQVSFKVPSNQEPNDEHRELCNTGIFLIPGDELRISVEGKVSTNGGVNWMEPTGVYPHPDTNKPIFYHDNSAYSTQGFPQPEVGNNGVVGSVFGWIGKDASEMRDAFFIGNEHFRIIGKNEEGFLYIAVNDIKGDYDNNKGEFDVRIEVKNQSFTYGQMKTDSEKVVGRYFAIQSKQNRVLSRWDWKA